MDWNRTYVDVEGVVMTLATFVDHYDPPGSLVDEFLSSGSLEYAGCEVTLLKRSELPPWADALEVDREAQDKWEVWS